MAFLQYHVNKGEYTIYLQFKIVRKITHLEIYLLRTFYGLLPFIRTLTGITGCESPVAALAPAPAPTGGLHTPTSTSSTTPTSTSTSVIFPLALHPWTATV